LHTIGQPFTMLYLVNSGWLKTVSVDETGNEKILGFHMKGDVIGVDGIHSKSHCSEAVSLTTCDIIAIPFKSLIAIGRHVADFEMAMLGVMSRELIREQHLLVALGSLGADARVGRFLASMSERLVELGLPDKQFTLHMTRQEIGNYLGLTVESVSRALSGFHAAGYITVNQRVITIHDISMVKMTVPRFHVQQEI
jgi:CRP/FNR family transcriptional regulator